MSEEELNQIRYDLLALCDRLKEFSAKFFSAGEKGPALSEEWKGGTTSGKDYAEIYYTSEPERESTTKVTHQTTATLSGVKIVHETERAYIVEREDGLSCAIAKSHLAKTYSKADVRTELEFKPERAWALEKLEWSKYER